MKVCLVTSEFPPVIGGIASHVYELARALAAGTSSVTVVDPQRLGPLGSGFDLPVGLVIRPRLIMAQPFYSIMLRHWLSKVVAKNHFDLVHVHGMRPLAATRGLTVPVVFTNHSSGFLARLNATAARKRRTAELLKHVAAVLAPSDELVDAVRAFGFSGLAEMIPNGVDVCRFKPARTNLRSRWGISEDETIVLVARRLVEKNGVVWFARSVAEMKGLRFRAVVAGNGPEKDQMTDILQSAGMLERVTFLGGVPNPEMPAVYNACDIAVLPSLAEATSIAGLEAMASGLPLVGTRVGGIPILVQEGVTGLLVPPRDPLKMAHCISQLIQNPEQRRRFGEAARRSAEENFSWTQIARRTLSFYERCVAAHKANA